jgi:uncharacterized protein (DUF433 family)
VRASPLILIGMEGEERLEERIVFDPQILVGKATVKGTRISVEAVLCSLAASLDFDDLFAAFPRLTEADVKACLVFASKQVRRHPKAQEHRRKLLGRSSDS